MLTLRQAIEQAMRDEIRLEDAGGIWEASNLLDALVSAHEHEALDQEVTINAKRILDEHGHLLYKMRTSGVQM